jgi:hypothetical protein
MPFLLMCPSCPIGQRARDEFCAFSPGYYSVLALLPYAMFLLAPSLLYGVTRARHSLRTFLRRGEDA